MSKYDEQINALDELYSKKEEERNKKIAKDYEESLSKADAVENIYQKIILPHLQKVQKLIREKEKKVTISNNEYTRVEGYDKKLLSKIFIEGGIENNICTFTISSDAGSGIIRTSIVNSRGGKGYDETIPYTKFTEELMESLCNKFIHGFYKGYIN